MLSPKAKLVWLAGLLLVPAGCQPSGTAVQAAADYKSPRASQDYPWPHTEGQYKPLAQRFPPPAGFQRGAVAQKSWKEWLRHLPLRQPGTPVRSRDGLIIVPANSSALAAVVDLDVRSNQECADTIQRLWAEYLWWGAHQSKIVFHLTSEGTISWAAWKQGMRPRLEGNQLNFYQTARPDGSRGTFEKYLDAVFAWCGTLSLVKDSKPVPAHDVQAGDFFVHGSSPGHATLIADVCKNQSGQLKALLVQGFMPAQSAHVLAQGRNDPWFDLTPGVAVHIPRWGAFEWPELRRFRTNPG